MMSLQLKKQTKKKRKKEKKPVCRNIKKLIQVIISLFHYKNFLKKSFFFLDI
jgi:hypothetical protein